ncbi:conjugal transfer protein TraF [Vibrio sp. RC27]
MALRLKTLALATAFVSMSSHSASYAIEARGDAMGGVGVVSASYLTAPFYNPALTAIYRRNDDAGMILPSIGGSYEDPDQFVDAIENLADLIEEAESSPSLALESELETALENMQGKQLKSELGAVVAIGIPNSFVSMTAYGKVYAETYVTSDIDTSDSNTINNAQNSSINAVSVGIAEAGLTLAKYSHYLGQHIALGITPKVQRIYTFVYNASFDDYSILDVGDNSTKESMINVDAGAVWFYGPLRVGLSAMNLISKDIETQSVNGNQYYYSLEPQYTVGFGLVADYATLSVDYDLKEESHYVGFDDNTQMIRVGGEIDLLRQLKLRAGYNKNLAYDSTDPTWTAGVGISPLGLVELDLAVSYSGPDSKGAYINFLSTF